VTSKAKRSLFGGALLAAGIAAPTAHAQNFAFQDSYSYVAAFDASDYSPFSYDYFFGPGFHSVSASVDGAGSDITASINQISNSSRSSAKSYLGGGINFYSYFTVDNNTLANINWDFSADEGPGGQWIDSYLAINDLSTGGQVFFTDLNNPIGSTQVKLETQHQYFLQGVTVAWNGAGTSSFNVSIPAPGAAGLLGVAGLVAARRRR
jgi:hypothetical protein